MSHEGKEFRPRELLSPAISLAEPSGSVARFLAPLELARSRIFFARLDLPAGSETIYLYIRFVPPRRSLSPMIRTSRSVAVVCATLFLAGLICWSPGVVAQDKDKDKKADKKIGDADKKVYDKDKKIDKDKKVHKDKKPNDK